MEQADNAERSDSYLSLSLSPSLSLSLPLSPYISLYLHICGTFPPPPPPVTTVLGLQHHTPLSPLPTKHKKPITLYPPSLYLSHFPINKCLFLSFPYFYSSTFYSSSYFLLYIAPLPSLSCLLLPPLLYHYPTPPLTCV